MFRRTRLVGGLGVWACFVALSAPAQSPHYGDPGDFYTELSQPMDDVWVIDVAEDQQGRVWTAVSVDDAAGARVEVQRFLPNAQVDPAFNAGMPYELAGTPTTPPSGAMTFDGSGNLLVAYTTLSPAPQLEDLALECITASGVLCGSLVADSGYGTRRDAVRDVAVCGSDIVLVGSTVWNTAGDTDGLFVQVDTISFQLDSNFAGDGILHVTGDLGGSQADELHSVACVPDGRVAVGAAATVGGSVGWAVAVTDAGDLDPSFSGDGRGEFVFEDSSPVRGVGLVHELNQFHHLLVHAGSYYAAGATAETAAGQVDLALAKISTDGALDLAWGLSGWAVLDFSFPGASRDDVALGTMVGADSILHVVGRSIDPGARGAVQASAAVLMPVAADGAVIEDLEPGGYVPTFVPLSITFDPQSAISVKDRRLLLAGHANDMGDQLVVLLDVVGEPPLFADHFETGDTSRWSSTSP